MQLNNVIINNSSQGYCKAHLSIAEGRIQDIEIVQSSLGDLSGVDFYVTPGFVNAHLHPNQLLDRRLLDSLSISQLLHGMHHDYKKTDEDRYAQALLVIMEAIRSGATTLYAVASHPGPVIDAFKYTGAKGAITCFYNDQWEGFGAPPALSLLHSIEEQFAKVMQHRSECLAIHIGSASVESASNELLLLMDELAKRYKTKVNIHVSEGSDSVRSCLQSRKLSPIRLLSQLNVLGPRWNLVHAVSLDAEEISLIAESGSSIIHCPVSNAKTGVGVAPIIQMIRQDIKIGLGSDACSNNNTNNILNEAYFAALIHAACEQDANILSVKTLMHWLTSQGHEIVGTGQKGALAIGEPADLLLWSLHESPFVPLAYGKFDQTLIYNAPDIKPHTVLIDGQAVVENYRFTRLSEKEIRDAANRCGSQIQLVI
jgi:5-methylthioadenosine/S-adenosylhomocysteine deaminase